MRRQEVSYVPPELFEYTLRRIRAEERILKRMKKDPMKVNCMVADRIIKRYRERKIRKKKGE